MKCAVDVKVMCIVHAYALRALPQGHRATLASAFVLLWLLPACSSFVQPGRELTVEMMTQLRVACIDLLNVLMAWEPFRTLPEPVSGMHVTRVGCSF